ncbi:MAG: radical SAM protein [Gammaproteobacteria bacterium]|nr:radical SAM protein [Gammaproteobacteria bacterium]
MPKITLATLNARYIHASLGLRYLKANMAELGPSTTIREFVITHRPIDVAETLLADSPAIIGLGVYIWNVTEVTALVGLLKAISPATIIVLGGPEVSYETQQQVLYGRADYIITGMADLAFVELCRNILAGTAPSTKVMHAPQPPLAMIRLPYDQFTEEDVANRVIYVEASRGCPFKCEFCLSSLDKTAWPFDIERFLEAMQGLYAKGVRHYKFVDRTFNLKIDTSIRILEFFLGKQDDTLFLHFELIPDHLPDKLKTVIQRFAEGSLQFEIGIQTFNPEVQALISRKQDNQQAVANIQWLTQATTAHLHTDLIVGLPGEDMQSFARGFDRLIGLNPGEIQVGILKRLRGTPIIRHTERYDMRYNPAPPYNVLSTDRIDFRHMQRLSRFARYWDMLANSGRFKNTLPVLLGEQPFDRFMGLSDWLFATTQQTHKISLKRLFDLIYEYLTTLQDMPALEVARVLGADYARSGQKGLAGFMSPTVREAQTKDLGKAMKGAKRQARHVG